MWFSSVRNDSVGTAPVGVRLEAGHPSSLIHGAQDMLVTPDSCPCGHLLTQKSAPDTFNPKGNSPISTWFIFLIPALHRTLGQARDSGTLNRVHLPVCSSGLKVPGCPLTPFVGQCVGSPTGHPLAVGWLCHIGASQGGSRARVVVAGCRGHSRGREASLISGCKGPACLFFLALALVTISGRREGSSKNHRQMETPFALLLSGKTLTGNHALYFPVRHERLPVTETHSASDSTPVLLVTWTLLS